MSEVNHKIDGIVLDLINSRILLTEKMTQKTCLFYNSINLLYSNDYIMIFSSPHIVSTISSSHFTNSFYRSSILHIWNLIIASLNMFNMCSKKCTSVN